MFGCEDKFEGGKETESRCSLLGCRAAVLPVQQMQKHVLVLSYLWLCGWPQWVFHVLCISEGVDNLLLNVVTFAFISQKSKKCHKKFVTSRWKHINVRFLWDSFSSSLIWSCMFCFFLLLSVWFTFRRIYRQSDAGFMRFIDTFSIGTHHGEHGEFHWNWHDTSLIPTCDFVSSRLSLIPESSRLDFTSFLICELICSVSLQGFTGGSSQVLGPPPLQLLFNGGENWRVGL